MSNKLEEAADLASLKENISEVVNHGNTCFNVQLQNDICVVDFTVPWAPACITMERSLDDMAKEFPNVKFIKVSKNFLTKALTKISSTQKKMMKFFTQWT